MPILATAAKRNRAAEEAMLLRQIVRTTRALMDAHKAAGDVRRTRELAATISTQLKAVHEGYTAQVRQNEWDALPEAAKRAREVVQSSYGKGSPVPAKLTPAEPDAVSTESANAPRRAPAPRERDGNERQTREERGEGVTMSDDDGGVEESVNSSARIALTVASQLGEKIARAYQEAMRDARQRDAALVRELSARFEAERSSARQAVAVVGDSQWWDNASIQDVARVAETAAAWKNADPQIARADAVIAVQAVERYGVDIATLSAVVRDTPSELDLAKQWASTSAPEGYHRHDEDRLTMGVGDSLEPNRDAERALVADYRAAIAGDVPALELSVAEEWKRQSDPTGFQDYRVETALAFNDNGRAVPADPAMAEAARLALIQEWRTEQAGGAAVVAADAERARSRGDLTEAQVTIAEADRLDRSNDAAIAATTDTPRDARDLSGIADELDRRAGEYERDADNGGIPTQTSDELRELAVDARAQATLYRNDSVAHAPAEAAAAPTAEGRASAARAEGEIAYDSAERRAHTAEAMRSEGVPKAQISARMTVDASFSTPARESVAQPGTSVPRTRKAHGKNRTIERPEQSR